MGETFKLSDGSEYKRNIWGGISQINAVPIEYSSEYSLKYNAYQSERINAIRLGNVRRAIEGHRPRSIVDFGYGNGAFLDYCHGQGVECYGVDVAPQLPWETGWRKISMEQAMGRIFEFATFFDSLEHMEDLSFLAALQAQYLVISVPHANLENWDVTDFEAWHHRRPNEHLHHFSEIALRKCLESFGYAQEFCNHSEDAVRIQPWPRNILTSVFRKKILVGKGGVI